MFMGYRSLAIMAGVVYCPKPSPAVRGTAMKLRIYRTSGSSSLEDNMFVYRASSVGNGASRSGLGDDLKKKCKRSTGECLLHLIYAMMADAYSGVQKE
jgi:hypothetical protein